MKHLVKVVAGAGLLVCGSVWLAGACGGSDPVSPGGSGGKGGEGTSSSSSGNIGGAGGMGGVGGMGGIGGAGTGGAGGMGGIGGAGGGIVMPTECTRTVYVIPQSVNFITMMDPYIILKDHAIGPDTAYAMQTELSDDVLTPGVEAYQYYVLNCPPGAYTLTWEGRAAQNSNGQIFIAVADATYVPGTLWPTENLLNVPKNMDKVHTVAGLVPDAKYNIFVRVNSTVGNCLSDRLSIGP